MKNLVRKAFLTFFAFIFAAASNHHATAQSGPATEVVQIDANAPGRPFPHFWEHIFGSGRASLSMRESYRRDLREVKSVTDFRYVRFHAILLDDMGVYSEDTQGSPVYNFSYVDQVYDGLLQNGIRPFVELSFMPKALASKDAPHAFWYKQNVSPPKDWKKWDDLIYALTKHCVDRYGLDEVATWYFEVWNEPNIDFWVGEPKQSTYFELYDHTAAAVKRVSPRLRTGGPATAQAAWVDAFIKHCTDGHIPLDFVSTHVYGNDRAEDVFGTHEIIPRDKMVCRSVAKVHTQIKESALPNLPLIWSEFNASYANEPAITDSTYLGPWLADTIRQCDGLVEEMSYWSFSDVFEEQGVVKQPFYGGYGVIAEDGIPKPAFYSFELLHHLGDERISIESSDVIATRRKDGSLVFALWNLTSPGEPGSPKTITLKIRGAKKSTAYIQEVNHEHGDVHSAYEKMGSPQYPTREQVIGLRKQSQLPAAQKRVLKNGEMTLTLPSDDLTVVELK